MKMIKGWYKVAIFLTSILSIGIVVGSVITYYLMSYDKPVNAEEFIISENTRYETYDNIDNYKQDNEELNTTEGDLSAVVEAEFIIPETRTIYEIVEVYRDGVENDRDGFGAGSGITHRFKGNERGGFTGLIKAHQVEMVFNPFVIPVDVEIKRSGDKVYAGVSTTNREVELSDMAFYADKSELFPEKNISVGIACGMNSEGTAVVHGRVGVKGYDVIYEYSGSHEILVGKSFSF